MITPGEFRKLLDAYKEHPRLEPKELRKLVAYFKKHPEEREAFLDEIEIRKRASKPKPGGVSALAYQILRLNREGLTEADIARELKCSREYVNVVVTRYGRRRKLEVVNRIGVSKTVIDKKKRQTRERNLALREKAV